MTRTPWYIAAITALAVAVSALTLMPAGEGVAIVTIVVDSTLDEPDAVIGDGLCKSTPSGVCTLRAAIQETNALAGKDIIDLPTGTYTLTIGGTGEDASATGDLDITDDVIIDGAAGIPNVDADGIDRAFDIDPAGAGLDVEMYDFRVTNGLTPASASGGGLLAGSTTTTLLIQRAFFEDNTADDFGGAIYNSADLTIIDAEFRRNTATDGGALYDGAVTTSTLTDVGFWENTATDDAGAIYSTFGMTLTDTLFYHNTAVDRGGAVLTELSFSLTTGSFHMNTADMGGAFFAASDSAVDLHDVTMDDNFAMTSGGAVYNEELFDMTSSTVSANRANVDGAGFFNTGDGILDLRNVTTSGNQARINGGGVANYGDLVAMNNVTNTLNIADSDVNGTGMGGGVFTITALGVDTVISNTIVGSNGFPVSSPDCAGPLTSDGYNLIEDTTGCIISGITTGNIIGSDPNLISLQDNGGNTLTHDLGAASPARDAGNPATPGTIAGSCETIDQRELSRPRDSDGDGTAICEMGALEAPGGVPSATPFGTGSPTATAAPTDTPTPTATTPPTGTPTGSPTATATPAPVLLVWADANCLSGINPVDSLAVLRADAGLFVTQGAPCAPLGDVGVFDGVPRTWGDFDCDLSMSPVDSLKILQYDSGFEPIQAAGCPDFGDPVELS